MSEFNIEEKAKRYDEALDNAKVVYKTIRKDLKPVIEQIFPELKESDDERIRKTLIDLVKCNERSGYTLLNNVSTSSMLAWLEKQGEQKSANKVEPKFKEGDWVVFNGLTLYINEVVKGYYRTISKSGTPNSYDWNIDNAARLWTIKDAKDGDILWHSDSASNGIFIFKEIKNDGKVLCYCDYDSEDHFCLGEHHTCCWTSSKYVKPATKEQRDLLFQKMHEAGYEWDADKKKLKKIDQKPVEETFCDRCKKAQPSHSCQDITELGRCYLEHEKQGEQKLIWDKFDDLMLKDTIEFIESGWSGNGKSHLIYWLKSIKDRIK